MATAASTPATILVGSRSLIDYWHLLSLDAPTVAALWACALCTATHVTVPVPLVFLLALGTWLLYAADRVLDGIRPADQELLRERHHFHKVHRRAFGGAVLAVSMAIAWMAARNLSRQMLLDSFLVLAAAGTYFVVVHWGASPRVWFRKEIAVGIIFAVAVSLPAWSQRPPGVPEGHFLAVVALLAALFWLNCAAIESWESGSADYLLAAGGGKTSAFNRTNLGRRPFGSGIRYGTIGMMLASISLFAADVMAAHTPLAAWIYLSVFISAAALHFLDGSQKRLSPLRLRIAADFALLTPLIFLILPRLLKLPDLVSARLR